MANMASVAYAIEGPKESLEQIQQAVIKGMKTNKDYWTEYKACEALGFDFNTLDTTRLGGSIEEEPYFEDDGSLTIHAEERWGLQGFCDLLEAKFPDIKIYWIVEESGCEVYCTNDKEGKHFPDRYYCELCQDDFSDYEYFKTEEAMYNWLSEKTQGRVHNAETAEQFNQDYEETGDECENYITIHQFEVVD